ncbi:MAG: murein biosynthesis integral membrane protein MurJ [Firmicutes bacterium]|nr:murein biosynthesis integral membrane protein MurJ [Bacillota bacterium]
MKKAALILAVIIVLSKMLGLLRDITLSYFYGASSISDAYLISITIPVVLFGFIITGISTIYIPINNEIEKQHGGLRANAFTNNLVVVITIIITVIITFGMIFTELLINVFATGFDGETKEIAIYLTKINLFGIFFTAYISIFASFVNIKGKYIITAFIGIPLNLIVISSIIISYYGENIKVLAFGNVFSLIISFFLLYTFAKKEKYKFYIQFNPFDSYLKKMILMAIPVMLGVSINEINVIVDRTIASTFEDGGISILNYASKISGFILGIFILIFNTLMFPRLSKMVVNKENSGFMHVANRTIISINFLLIPALVGIMIFANPIIEIIYGRGAMSEKSISETSRALFYYSLGIFGLALREALSKMFYAVQDTRTPMINAIITILLNIILNIVLSRVMGLSGLALATSLSAILCSMLLYFSFSKKIGKLDNKKIILSFLKASISTLLMAIIAANSFIYLQSYVNSIISLIIAICIGVLFYIVCLFFLKVPEVNILVKSAKDKMVN